jgi:hypothetical protein
MAVASLMMIKRREWQWFEKSILGMLVEGAKMTAGND